LSNKSKNVIWVLLAVCIAVSLIIIIVISNLSGGTDERPASTDTTSVQASSLGVGDTLAIDSRVLHGSTLVEDGADVVLSEEPDFCRVREVCPATGLFTGDLVFLVCVMEGHQPIHNYNLSDPASQSHPDARTSFRWFLVGVEDDPTTRGFVSEVWLNREVEDANLPVCVD
jgi:hypothetical protein